MLKAASFSFFSYERFWFVLLTVTQGCMVTSYDIMKRTRGATQRVRKKTAKEKKNNTKTDADCEKEQSESAVIKQSNIESGENKVKTEKQTSVAEEEKTSRDSTRDDVISNQEQGSAAGGRTEERTLVKTEEKKQIPDLFFRDDDGDTYLHIAVVQCNEGLVNFLVQAMKSTNLDIYNKLRQTPLHLAVITGQKNLISLLIKAGSDVNAVDRNGQTPLHLACRRNDVQCACAIFDSLPEQKHIAINATNFEGFSPLHLATIAGNRDLLGLLLEKGADINIKDTSSGRTVLHHAVEAGKEQVVEFLLSRGAKANVATYSGNSPLHTAAGRYMSDIVRLLTKYGADVNLANMEGDKPKVVHSSSQGQRQLAASRKRAKTTKDQSSLKTTSKKTKS